MTAAELLAVLLVAMAVQVAALGAWAWRQRTFPAPAPPLPVVGSIRPDGTWSGLREFRVAGKEFEDAHRSQCSFTLRPVDGRPLPDYQPGQYLAVEIVPHGATTALLRCYSLSDRPDPDAWRITVKRAVPPPEHPEAPAGEASVVLHDQVQVGDTLRARAPKGRFVLDPDPRVPAVLIGGGIGITPMISMARWLMAHQPERPFHLYYGVRDSGDRGFVSTLDALAAHPAARLHLVYSRPGAGDVEGRDFQHRGRISVDLLRRTLPAGRHAFHVCGPAAMMETLVPELAAWGVPIADLRYESFGPSTVPLLTAPDGHADPEPTEPVPVQFCRSGRTLDWDGQDDNLLDFAERHRVRVASSCRTGGCGSCVVRVRSGEVRYATPPDAELEPGYALLCVGRPVTRLELEA